MAEKLCELRTNKSGGGGSAEISGVVSLGIANGTAYSVNIGDIIVFIAYNGSADNTTGLTLLATGLSPTSGFNMTISFYKATATTVSITATQGFSTMAKVVF